MKETLVQLSKGVQTGPAADLVTVLFGERPPAVSVKDVKFTPFNSNLDHSQVSEVQLGLFLLNLYTVFSCMFICIQHLCSFRQLLNVFPVRFFSAIAFPFSRC